MEVMSSSSSDYLFYNQLNPNQNEMKELLQLLAKSRSTDEDPQKTLEVLKSLRRAVKKSGNHLGPDFQQDYFFACILPLLREEDQLRPQLLCECLWLCVDLIPNLNHHSLDQSLAPIIREVVPLLGHESADVRRAALRLLHVQMRHTLNLQKSLKTLVQFGLEAGDARVQRGTVLSLPLLIGEEFQHENLFLLVDSLCQLLVTADNQLFYPVFLALQRLNTILGNSRFKLALNQVRAKEARELYESVLSRNNSANNDKERGEEDTGEEQENYLFRTNQNNQPLSGQAMEKRKNVTFGQQESEDNTSDTTYDLFLRYQLFPSGLLWSVLNGDTNEERVVAIESMSQIVRDSPLKKLMSLLVDMNRFLDEFVQVVLQEDNSFKVTLLSLDILEVLVERLKTSMTPFLGQLLHILTKRLGDQRTVVRDSVIRVIHSLMYTFPPQLCLDHLLQQKPAKNPKIREHVINRVSAAVLTFPSSEFQFPRLIFPVVPFLADTRRCVRLAALECTAVLAQAITPARVVTLLSAVEAVQQNCGCDGLLSAVQTRLSRRQLPKVSADGTIRYFLNPSHVTGWPADQPDLEWVLLAPPLSHNGTPPSRTEQKRNRMSSNGVEVTNIPFDRRKQSTVVTHLTPPSAGEELGLEEGAERRRSLAVENIEHLLMSGSEMKEPEAARSPSVREVQLDQFRGVSFNSDDMDVEGGARGGGEEEGVEVWKEYFSRFRQQLADQLIGLDEQDNENVGQHVLTRDRRKSDVTPLPVAFVHAQEDVTCGDVRVSSPVQSSSAPSTASLDKEREIPVIPLEDVLQLQRSISLPSIEREIVEEDEEMIVEDVVKEEDQSQPPINNETQQSTTIRERVSRAEDQKPSPMLSTPLQSQTPEVNNNNMSSAQDPPLLTIQEATPLKEKRRTEQSDEKSVAEHKLDVWTQKDESSETGSEDQPLARRPEVRQEDTKRKVEKRAQPMRGRVSRSQSPQARRRPSLRPQRVYIKTTPAIAANANIRSVLQSVSSKEGPLESPLEGVRAALLALQDDAWTTKVEGMLVVVRLAQFHPGHLHKEQHHVVSCLIKEVKNLRSTVSRSAIFCLGELFRLLKVQVEPEMDAMVTCLLHKSGENVVFIRDDIERALHHCLDELPQTRTALALIQGGAGHRNSFVRRTCAHFLALLVHRMGPTKCLLGPRDIAEHLLPAAARFVQDPSPHTRFFGRKIMHVLMGHTHFEKLLRKHVTPGTFRNIVGILESIRRRGPGEPPQDVVSGQSPKSSPVFD